MISILFPLLTNERKFFATIVADLCLLLPESYIYSQISIFLATVCGLLHLRLLCRYVSSACIAHLSLEYVHVTHESYYSSINYIIFYLETTRLIKYNLQFPATVATNLLINITSCSLLLLLLIY